MPLEFGHSDALAEADAAVVDDVKDVAVNDEVDEPVVISLAP